MTDVKPKCDFLIEVSYEIVAKLGGINSVIKTKAPFMRKYYEDNYLVVGLYEKKAAKLSFEKKSVPKYIKNIFNRLSKEGIVCHYGVWKVKSSPQAIIIDIKKVRKDKNLVDRISTKYFVNFLKKATMYNDSMIFSYCAGRLISEIIKSNKKKKFVVNIHEYMCALTLFYLRKHKCDIPIVFTTHATVLGRALAFQGRGLYKDVISTKKDKDIYYKKIRSYLDQLGNQIYNKHFQEQACARNADVFTAVSDVTSKEAGFLLDKSADIVTPNGFETIKYPRIEKQIFINYKAKEAIYQFLKSYFSPYYNIKEKKNTLFFYTAGRDEIYTKGYDIFFEALQKLNSRLKNEKINKEIFVFLFIMIPGKKRRKLVFDALKKNKTSNKNNPPNFAFKVKNDKILSLYRKKNKLQNKKNDKVKVIFYPAPVKEDDKLLSMPYDKVISGMSLGIFPSLYEPWGYTPLETAAMSTLTITTDVSGFGKFIEERSDQRKVNGIMVLKTKNKNRESIVRRLSEIMHEIVNMPAEEVLKKRIEANKMASLANWEEFSKYYIKAHNLALKKHLKTKK